MAVSMALRTLSEVMTKNVIVASPLATLESVRRLMIGSRVSRVVVVNEASLPIGVITSKDILGHALMGDIEKEPDEVAALHVMSRPVVTVSEEASVASCAARMLESAISSIVVVRGGALAGIVTKTDMCRFYAERGIPGETVGRWMTPRPISARTFLRLLAAARLMENNKIGRLPVVDEKLEGIITLSDLTAVSPALHPSVLLAKGKAISVRGRIVLPTKVAGLTVGEVMTRNPVTISGAAALSDAAGLMLARGISGLPVLGADRDLVGIVTKTDVTKAAASIR